MIVCIVLVELYSLHQLLMGDAVAHRKQVPGFTPVLTECMVLWGGSCIYGFFQPCEMGLVGFLHKKYIC